MVDNTLFIKKYNEKNKIEFKKLKLPKEFRELKIQTFDYDKNIYILNKKRGFLKSKIIGYAIISNYSGVSLKEKELLAKFYKINQKLFIEHTGYYIDDFMIKRSYRRQGYATLFFNMLRKQFYYDDDVLLCADGDGLKFWDKVNFQKVDTLTSCMILKANYGKAQGRE